jgi:hypothetical protein
MEERSLPAIEVEALRAAMESEIAACLQKVTEAVNAGRAGSVIQDSEEMVRQATADFRRKVFEKAIQMKTQAAEAAFSPSGQGKSRRRTSS